MSKEKIVSQEQEEISLKSYNPTPPPEDPNALHKEKTKYTRSEASWKREKVSCIISVISFAVYVVVGGWLQGVPGKEIAANAVTLIAALGMIQHWVLVLLKINSDPIASNKKLLSYLGVIVFAAIGAWVYTVTVSRKLNAGQESAV